MDFRAFEATPGISVIVQPNTPVYTYVAVSNDFIRYSGMKREEVVGKGHFELFPQNPADPSITEASNLKASFEYIIQHKVPHEIPMQRYDIPNGDGNFSQRYWKINNAPILSDTGEVLYIIHSAVDITEKVLAEEKAKATSDLERSYSLFMNAPVIIGILKGDNYVIELANEGLLEVWGRTGEVVGQPLLTAIPELEAQGFIALLDQVRATGEPFYAYEFPITLNRQGRDEVLYFDFVYKPFYERGTSGKADGIISVGHNVTDQVRSRQKFQNVVQQSPDPILILKGKDMVLEVANEALFRIWNVDETAIGKPFLEILPEMKEQGFLELLQKVYETGETFHGFQTPAVFREDTGESRTVYFNFTYQPYREADGTITGVLVLATNVTGQVLANKNLVESERNLRNTILQSPVAMCILRGPLHVVEVANDRMFELWGKEASDVLAKPVFEGIPEARNQDLEAVLQQVYTTGAPFAAHELPVQFQRKGTLETVFVNFVYEPFREGDGSISGIIGVAIDVTEQVLARKKVEESEQKLRSLVESAPFPIAVYIGKEMRIDMANQSIMDIWGKGYDVIGKLYSDVLPELDNQEVFSQLERVFETGLPFHAKHQRLDLIVDGKAKVYYFNYSFTPLFDANGKVYGVMNTGADVTDLNLTKQQVEQSERNFRNMVLQAPVAMCILLGEEHVVDVANDAMIALWGKPKEAVMHKPIFEGLPDAKEQGLERLLADAFHTGVAYTANEHPVELVRNGKQETVYQNFVYEPYRDAEGKILGVLAISIDVTEQVLARRKVEESREELHLAIEVAELGTFHVNLLSDRGMCSQRVMDWFGFKEPNLDMNSIFSTIHPEDQQRVIQSIQQSTLAESNSRHDITYRVPDPISGTERHLRSIGKAFFDKEGKAYQIRGVIQDVTPQILYQQRIEESEAQLQKRVAERTQDLENLNKELKRTNANLEEFAYAASHDMKEPIRKIHFFSDRLKTELKDKLTESQGRLFERLEFASRRMGTLIDDLLTYSQATKGVAETTAVDLNQKLQIVLDDLELEIHEKKARISIDPLPTVWGNSRQFQQAFQNLLSNALKYSKPEEAPEIKITAKIVKGKDVKPHVPAEEEETAYHLIGIRDNGIGFEQADAERIFNVFTRLHGLSEYKGTGVGLSIVQKVILNHKGCIWAASAPGQGATFNILLPVYAPENAASY